MAITEAPGFGDVVEPDGDVHDDLVDARSPRHRGRRRADGGGAGGSAGARARRQADNGGRGGGHLPYFPALDGVRGLAVISVLFFHAGFSWAVGGYLGVSTFFTLSGFLITSLLLAERTATGNIGLRGFWTRRFRRLLPAALAAIALGVVVALLIDPVQRRNIGGDAIAALGDVANWRFVFSGQSYAELFTTPSPLQHFWSLAIEEQFYLIYPLLAFGLLRIAKGSVKLFTGALVVLTALSVGLPLYLGYSTDRIYYGTDARAAELLMGALLATALYYRPITDRLATNRRVQRTVAVLGAIALVGCVVMWIRVDQQSAGLYKAGFFGYSILSVLVILAALLPVGPVAVALAVRPLRFMGKISYGVYLYHWPIFLAVNEQRVPLSGIPLFVVRVALTIGVACASFYFLEMPIRRGQPLFGGTRRAIRPVRLAPFVVCLLGVVAIIVGLTSPPPAIDFEQAQRDLTFSNAPPPTSADPAAVTPPAQPRIAMFGDSTALETAFGLGTWLTDTGRGVLVQGQTQLGCSVIRNSARFDPHGEGFNNDECNHWDTTFKQAIDQGKPDVAVVQDGPWEVLDHQLPEDKPGTYRHLGDPVFDHHLTSEMTGVIDTLSAQGAIVYWMTLPPMTDGGNPANSRGDGGDPARQQDYNRIVNALPYLRPGKVHVIDLAGWLASTGEDARLRPDGVHFSNKPDGGTSLEVANRWLGDTIVKAFDADWTVRATAAQRGVSAEAAAPAPSSDGGTASGPAPSGAPVTPTSATVVPATPAAWRGQLGGLPPPRTEVVGDSTALGLALGMHTWSAGGQGDGVMKVASTATIGCGIGRGGLRKNHDKVEPVPPECQTWATDIPKMLATAQPDLVVVMDGLWDATDRQLAADPTWRAPGDPVYDAYLHDEFSQAADLYHGRGAPVVWLTFPTIDLGVGEPDHADHPYAVSDPARMRRVNDIVRDVAPSRPWVHVLDLAAYADHFPKGPLDPAYRIDGVHFTAEAATTITQDWLAAQLLQIYRDSHLPPAGTTSI